MKTEISNLIDRLADKRPGMGCWIKVIDRKGQPIVRVAGVLGTTKYKKGRDGYCIFVENPKNGELEPLSYKDFEILGHPIHLHDVLEKMKEVKVYFKYSDKREVFLNPEQLLALWEPCGFTKSLQSIFDSAEWECQICDHIKSCPSPESLKPKQPHIRELFQFLLQLNLAE